MNEQNYQSDPPGIERPSLVTAIAIITLVNGILNILYAISVTFGIVLGTLGLGLLCAPLTILPGVLGIFEILYATQLLALPARPVKPNQTLAILEIVAVVSGNVISLVAGILVLVFYNDPAVRTYFGKINQ